MFTTRWGHPDSANTSRQLDSAPPICRPSRMSLCPARSTARNTVPEMGSATVVERSAGCTIAKLAELAMERMGGTGRPPEQPLSVGYAGDTGRRVVDDSNGAQDPGPGAGWRNYVEFCRDANARDYQCARHFFLLRVRPTFMASPGGERSPERLNLVTAPTRQPMTAPFFVRSNVKFGGRVPTIPENLATTRCKISLDLGAGGRYVLIAREGT